MQLLDRFTRLDYDSLEDFLANYDYTVPENFNFAYDVMDEYARLAPGQRAMIWTRRRRSASSPLAILAAFRTRPQTRSRRWGCKRAMW